MRIKISVFTVALLAAASMAWAQGTTPTATPTPTPITKLGAGFVDFGYRGTSVDGAEARYERYRDTRSGAYSFVTFDKKNEDVAYEITASNIGYRDQYYRGDYVGGKLKAYGLFDQIPLNYCYDCSTPWVQTLNGSSVLFALDDAAQLAVQNKVPGVVGVPSSAAQLATPSIYRGLAQQVDIQQQRSTTGLGASYDFGPGFNVNMSYTSTLKSGSMPWAASFAFNNANELALPLDNRTNDVGVSMEKMFKDGMVRVAWDGSWFNNVYHDMIWDNPLRATDFDNGKLPPNGPYDPSGYSNGNGPVMGRMSLPPDNSYNAVSVMGLYKMPAHSTLSGQISFTNMKQNDSLIPWTINSVINTPTVFAAFPGLATLPRSTAMAEVQGLNALFNFNTRPNKYFAFQMKYRFNDHDNQTPHFDAVEYVRFDAVPEETGGETEQFDVKRRTLDVNAIFTVLPYTALKIGYGYDAFNRHGRSFSDMADDMFKVSLDTTRWQWFTVRGVYEHVVRTGSGFSESALEDGGSQPGLRFYDESDRVRDRGTLLFILSPIDTLDFNVSYAMGKDAYGGEGHEFGLLDNKNNIFNFGATYTPTERMAMGFNYGRDQYTSNQKSRNANPPTTSGYQSWDDPNRDWFLDNDETVNNFDFYFDLLGMLKAGVIKNTDVRIGYNFSDSDNAWMHSGPRIDELNTNTAFTAGDSNPCSAGVNDCFISMPNVTNQWQRFTVDAKFYFSPKVGVGLGWWYEKLDVSDFGTIDTNGPVGFTPATGTPRIDYLGEINTGYGVRPYKGNTATVRLLFRF